MPRLKRGHIIDHHRTITWPKNLTTKCKTNALHVSRNIYLSKLDTIQVQRSRTNIHHLDKFETICWRHQFARLGAVRIILDFGDNQLRIGNVVGNRGTTPRGRQHCQRSTTIVGPSNDSHGFINRDGLTSILDGLRTDITTRRSRIRSVDGVVYRAC